ncbi:MAG: T9SS type A sorting domain-containing protein [Candidatus Aegiribacteria sp.]|nr:T9SS type A sorting domain-containing protein [Candidatus Aegiribacteria sp.]
MRCSLIVLLIMTFLLSSLYADITFLKIYETIDGWAAPFDVIETSNGGYVCTTNSINWTFLRTDEYGEVLVQDNRLWGYSLCENQNEELVTAYDSFTGGDYLINIDWADLMGNVLRTRVYDELSYYEDISQYCIIQTSDRGYAICGEMEFHDKGYVMKLDSLENYQWHVVLPDASLYSIVEDSENCLIAGGASSMDYVIKLSQEGGIIWENTYPCSSTTWRIWGIEVTSSGYVFASISGRVVGISSSGSFEWQYETAIPEIMYIDVCIAENGDVVACGMDNESGVLTRLNNNGDLVWEKEYESCRLGYIYSTADSGFVSTGIYTAVEPPDNDDILLLKVDSEGNCESLGIETEPELNNAQLFPVYPNPFSESAIIRYALTESGAVSISVFDVSGRLVSSPVDCISAAGAYSFTMNDLPSGVYMIRMRVSGHELVQRFVVID